MTGRLEIPIGFVPTEPTMTQAQDAYQFFLEMCRQHPEDKELPAFVVAAWELLKRTHARYHRPTIDEITAAL